MNEDYMSVVKAAKVNLEGKIGLFLTFLQTCPGVSVQLQLKST